MTTTEPSPSISDGERPAEGIGALIQERKITEVVHFTTNRGLLGILVQRLCKARALLAQDQYLESIYHQNTKIRREAPQYWSYVNLSISEPNHRFLRISSDDWWADEDLFWAVLSFDPVIMTHPGVLFAPGNMGYDGITPVEGLPGAEALFADRVPKGFNKTMPRWNRAPHLPTNPQAEVLYPQAVSTRHLQRIYVLTHEDAAKAEAIVSVSEHDEVDIIVDPVTFGR
ncbi:DarT ssDNA thymidine ADP-ribosyltransferase family protein [Streptomyces sp. NPDC096198]|uniref:DarT ssDNA thymidine ADP-ribosyltransferase family protein n=1 Tax=unclassified Streptomyces TaxID=2593676 RepID=UPI0007CFAFEA|nr:DarT ssDNA thymidine ADP-ribosyltransferase family protein [Streptomyces sp. FXJ1.172]WEP00487.1 DarT ssDNA thymidine ADP-ribosyltransferase family protein [Streptomyces sp. FXJ1.172]WEP00724.1 DarT ssDNA thymidine ADP-ribosyltransferase family protein [Streptomyces sp. FXJ1.172]